MLLFNKDTKLLFKNAFAFHAVVYLTSSYSNCHFSRNSNHSTSIEMQWNASDGLSALIFDHVMVICDIDFLNLASKLTMIFRKKTISTQTNARLYPKPSTFPFRVNIEIMFFFFSISLFDFIRLLKDLMW